MILYVGENIQIHYEGGPLYEDVSRIEKKKRKKEKMNRKKK